MKHIPVMTKEVLEYLKPQAGKKYIDATLGEGGHTKKVLDLIGPKGKMLLIDKSTHSIDIAKVNLHQYFRQCSFVCDNFGNLKDIVKTNNFNNPNGIIYDLGMSTWQIKDSGVGITFTKDEPLDMRLSQDQDLVSAYELINKFPAKRIADILYQYGDVRNSWSIARRIEQARREEKICTTFQLIDILKTKNPKFLAPVFQALRIFVNQELENLQKSLLAAANIINNGGRIVVISFHSGEDRIVKNIFREYKKLGKVNILTAKPICASREEIVQNPKSRSAKLRAVEII